MVLQILTTERGRLSAPSRSPEASVLSPGGPPTTTFLNDRATLQFLLKNILYVLQILSRADYISFYNFISLVLILVLFFIYLLSPSLFLIYPPVLCQKHKPPPSSPSRIESSLLRASVPQAPAAQLSSWALRRRPGPTLSPVLVFSLVLTGTFVLSLLRKGARQAQF